MRGNISEEHEYSYVVLNWLKRRGRAEKEEEVNEKNEQKSNSLWREWPTAQGVFYPGAQSRQRMGYWCLSRYDQETDKKRRDTDINKYWVLER